MAGDHGLSDLRFTGYENGELARQVNGLRNGAGPDTLYDAVVSLMKLADGLSDTDASLRQQLADIGVTWQGEAADGGTAATKNASIYADQSQGPVTDSAQGVDFQGAAFSTSKNNAPDSGSLNGPTSENGFDQFMGFLGHTTDHAQQVKETNASRQQAIDAMNGYQSSSSSALGQSQTLPVPPGLNLNAQPVDTSTHISSVAGFSSTSGLNPTGGPAGGSLSTIPGPGGGGTSPIPTPGINAPVTTGPLPGPGPLPGVGNPLFPTAAGPVPAALRAAANPLLMADAATALGAGGASGAGAGAEEERLSRNTAARGPVKNGAPIGTAPEEEARAARNAERFGAKTGRPGSSIMQPAAAGRKEDGEEDQEHVRRFGVDSSDVFDDDRVVAPESIGDDDE